MCKERNKKKFTVIYDDCSCAKLGNNFLSFESTASLRALIIQFLPNCFLLNWILLAKMKCGDRNWKWTNHQTLLTLTLIIVCFFPHSMDWLRYRDALNYFPFARECICETNVCLPHLAIVCCLLCIDSIFFFFFFGRIRRQSNEIAAVKFIVPFSRAVTNSYLQFYISQLTVIHSNATPSTVNCLLDDVRSKSDSVERTMALRICSATSIADDNSLSLSFFPTYEIVIVAVAEIRECVHKWHIRCCSLTKANADQISKRKYYCICQFPHSEQMNDVENGSAKWWRPTPLSARTRHRADFKFYENELRAHVNGT